MKSLHWDYIIRARRRVGRNRVNGRGLLAGSRGRSNWLRLRRSKAANEGGEGNQYRNNLG